MLRTVALDATAALTVVSGLHYAWMIVWHRGSMQGTGAAPK
jgi:hypothetical protein